MKKLPIYTNNVRGLCQDKFSGILNKEQIAALALTLYKAGYPVCERTVKNWYYQERQPSQKATVALCKVFDVEPCELLKF